VHPNSMRLMEYFRDKYLSDKKSATVLDVGAMVVARKNKTSYRTIFEPDYHYVGMDVEPGRNVDIVGYDSITTAYDVVISGQTMEHVKRPWEWLSNLTKYFEHYICVIAPHTWKEHKYPIDTYRYFPDGMRDLFEYAGIAELEIMKSENDTIGIGTHKGF
jgi:hypothetical protein